MSIRRNEPQGIHIEPKRIRQICGSFDLTPLRFSYVI
ncbi:hypothetical protein SAMN04490194_3819 [Pseudomonas migulae]|uniref:Uncharacterized protein n=1 Tax=Pseudomonas migulae TaxID=78543 RepID=A0A1H5LA47_9PSED|nr:hypothetical protein FBY04_11917 [Pseudomonas sp. SJZ080]SEE73840.1 hypothetical protein SAMN04490194_3819 [Pseudomonas migulae]